MYRQAETKECCLLKLNFIADLSQPKSRISAFGRRRNPLKNPLRVLRCETRSKTEHIFFQSLEFALASIMRHELGCVFQTTHASLDLRGITCYSLCAVNRYALRADTDLRHKEITHAETEVLLTRKLQRKLLIVYSVSFVFYLTANITSK